MQAQTQTERFSRWWRAVLPYALLAVAFLLLHLFYNPAAAGFINQNIRYFFAFAVALAIAAGVYLWMRGKLTERRMVALLFAVGVLVRMFYVLRTGIYERQHDADALENFGHWGYILHFMRDWRLPQTNSYQFYHPPLHHMLAGFWMRANELFGMELQRNLESVQYLTAFYSSCIMVVSHRIFKQIKLHGLPLYAATALLALHPALFILSGSINNDMLVTLLYAAAILWLLRWWERPNTKNTIALALCVGLGMMTKTSMASCAFVIAPFFVIKLFTRKPRAKRWGLISRLALFGGISIPIGMWHALRNLSVFGQPLGFVPLPGGPQYKGDLSLWQRLAPFPPTQIFNRLHASPWEDGNLSVYLLKSSLFGEWEPAPRGQVFAWALLALNLLLILLSLAALLYALMRKRKEFGMGAWVLGTLWALQLGFMLYFYISYPFGCTMDFRYMVPTLLCGAGFLGMAMQGENTPALRALSRAMAACVFCFCALSVIAYLIV